METPRLKLMYLVLVPALVIASCVLGYYAFVTARQFERLGEQSIAESSLLLLQDKIETISGPLCGGPNGRPDHEPRCCPRSQRAALAAMKPKSIRHLWADGSGAFRTQGRFAAATIRGTTWDTDDSCAGTLVKVTKGAVTVSDLVKRKSVALKAGHQYLAQAPRTKRR